MSAALAIVVAGLGLSQAVSAHEKTASVNHRRPHVRPPDGPAFDHRRGKGHHKCDDADHGDDTLPETPQWVREFGTTGNDYAGGVAVDPSGNAVMVGGSSDFTAAFVNKYDPSGNVLWSHEFPLGFGGAGFVGTDRLGNIYVVGGTTVSLVGQPYAGASDIFVRKYSPSGDELWTCEFGSAGYDSAFSAAFDSEGNTYLGGYAQAALQGSYFGGFEDGFAAKISNSGSILWITQIGTTGADYVNNVAVAFDCLKQQPPFDSSGNAYVTGNLNNDGFVSRLDGATGTVVWRVTIPNQVFFTEGTDVAVSTSGVYVAYELAGSTSSDALIRKYGLDGTELWSNVISGADFSNAGFRHLLVDATDEVYSVLAITRNGQADGVVRKLDPEGVEQWTVTLGGPGTDVPLDGALDPMGNLWLHFTEYQSYPGQTSSGGQDMAVVALDPSGNTLLAAQYGSPGNDFPAIPESIVIGLGGELYVASTVQGPVGDQTYLGMQDCLLTKFLWRSDDHSEDDRHHHTR